MNELDISYTFIILYSVNIICHIFELSKNIIFINIKIRKNMVIN